MAIQLLGLADAALDQAIAGFLLKSPSPSSSDVADFLGLFTAGPQRNEAGQALIAHGVSANTISMALTWLDKSASWDLGKIKSVLSLVSAGTSAFHGYRRNNSIWWAMWWGVMGGIFPVFVPVVALAQGFGKRKAA
jgi:hypothetical protein